MKPAIYCRCSTVLQDLDSQRAAVHAYVKYNGLDPLAMPEYADEGYSGANTDRPAWQRLQADLEAGVVDTVYVHDLTRAGRSTADLASWVERMLELKIRVVFIKEQIDFSQPVGRLILHILGAVAEFERTRIKENCKRGISFHIAQGKGWGGSRTIDPTRRGCRKFTNEQEAAIVARVGTMTNAALAKDVGVSIQGLIKIRARAKKQAK